jgi:hypothetical protein
VEVAMTLDLIQTLVHAVLLIGVTLILGSVFGRWFDALDRRFDEYERRLEAAD